MALRFCPLASGSDGNSIYVGTDSTHILIDAGLSGKRIETSIASMPYHLTCDKLDGIFVTHEHSDHISGVGVMSRRYNIPVFATQKTWIHFERHNSIGKISENNKRIIYKEENCILNDLTIKPFEISHDAAEPVGYSIFAENYKVSISTDLGYVSDSVKEHLSGSDILLLESNHDLDMLKNGSYPRELKDRVLSKRGHISNVTAGQTIAEIICPKLKHVYLGHLSAENNLPLLALDTVSRILEVNGIKIGVDLKLGMANRGVVSPMTELT